MSNHLFLDLQNDIEDHHRPDRTGKRSKGILHQYLLLKVTVSAKGMEEFRTCSTWVVGMHRQVEEAVYHRGQPQCKELYLLFNRVLCLNIPSGQSGVIVIGCSPINL